MRRSRYAGLNEHARELVKSATKTESIGNLSALFQTLKRYTLADGRVYTEYQQAVVQSITDVYFVALHDKQGNRIAESLWTEAEMKTW